MSEPSRAHESDAHATLARASALEPVLANYLDGLRAALRARLCGADGRPDAARLDADQRALHALAWTTTVAQAVLELGRWAHSLAGRNAFGPLEQHVVAIGQSEYLSQILGGIPMSAQEFARPADMGAEALAAALAASTAVQDVILAGAGPERRLALHQLVEDGAMVDESLGDDTLDLIREHTRRFTRERVRPHAHRWHLEDRLIPDSIIAEMAELGVFGITISP
jgi:(2S)-methylsuccinyl-CoA dehydrogenase